jgi:hypothetical protein
MLIVLLTWKTRPGRRNNVHKVPTRPPPKEAIVVEVAALAANFHLFPLIPNVLDAGGMNNL